MKKFWIDEPVSGFRVVVSHGGKKGDSKKTLLGRLLFVHKGKLNDSLIADVSDAFKLRSECVLSAKGGSKILSSFTRRNGKVTKQAESIPENEHHLIYRRLSDDERRWILRGYDACKK